MENIDVTESKHLLESTAVVNGKFDRTKAEKFWYAGSLKVDDNKMGDIIFYSLPGKENEIRVAGTVKFSTKEIDLVERIKSETAKADIANIILKNYGNEKTVLFD